MGRSVSSEPTQAIEDIVVAICTHSNARLLDRALATIEQQSVDPSVRWSVLVVDNNSIDETSAVVQKYIEARRIPGLRIVREPRQGLTYARRCAVRETSSELIALVDDDCLLSPNWVQEAVAFCRDGPMAGAVGGRVRLRWEVPPDEVLLRYEGSLARQDHGNVPRQMPVTGMTRLVGAGLVVRRRALETSGWMDHGMLVGRQGGILTAGDDSEIVLRIRRVGYELWYNPAMQLQHYIPRRRMCVEHICSLHRGFGQSWPILSTLGNDQKPTVAWRLRILASSLKGLVKLSLSIAVRDLLAKRQTTAERRIALYRALGRVEGSMRFLINGYQM